MWLSQVFRRWPGGATLALARVVAEQLRIPASLHVATANLDDPGVAARLPTTQPLGVGRLLDRLVTAASSPVLRHSCGC